MSRLHSISKAMSPVSMLIAILALVVAGAGAGYAAGKIGTNDIKNNAVTSPKVKNGTLKAADLVKEKKTKYVGAPGAPDFSNGGEGDCVWQSGSALVPSISRPGFRKDRFGTVHLVGVAVSSDGAGGDGVCGDESEDAIMFVLPAAFRPAKTQLRPVGDFGIVIVVGRNGLDLGGGTTLPAGAVAWSEVSSSTVILDGISYQPAGSQLVSGQSTERLTPGGRKLIKELLAG